MEMKMDTNFENGLSLEEIYCQCLIGKKCDIDQGIEVQGFKNAPVCFYPKRLMRHKSQIENFVSKLWTHLKLNGEIPDESIFSGDNLKQILQLGASINSIKFEKGDGNEVFITFLSIESEPYLLTL